MIEIKNLEPTTEIIDTYGYFSLGTIKSIGLRTGYRCSVSMNGLEFNLVSYNTGGYLIVLSDFSRIPDIAVIQASKVLDALENAINKYLSDLITITWSKSGPCGEIKYIDYDTINVLPKTSSNSDC